MLEIDNDLRDIFISALRYSLYRKTYVFEETISYITNNQRILDERTARVMLKDVENRITEGNLEDFEINILEDFRSVLKELLGWTVQFNL